MKMQLMRTTLILSLLVVISFSHLKAQEKSNLTELEANKIELVNDLCVITSVYGMNLNNFGPDAITYMGIVLDFNDKLKVNFEEKLRDKLSLELNQEYDAIQKGIDKMIEMNHNKSNETVFRNLMIYHSLMDNRIKRYIKALLK